ncbi:STAS domain-containing protein [Streptomyces sp. H27-G5]|uniref:STAS domain-containing protein n=1 Tax=Streptomyces sp. H27-G5 TaxID=2996698 RepID=UPI00226FA434|nr:STAS domain-containing protein [Streptomyces sp. H27-G5]MCY0918491.1 STAS domain-containing protein [Streptomyces sp. H27-G5]
MSTATSSPILAHTTPHDTGADSAPCAITVHSRGNVLTIAPTGEIDHHTARPLRVTLALAAAHGYTGLVLDTSRVTFADSGLLRVLDEWCRHGRRLRMVNQSKAVQRLLAAAAATGPAVPSPYGGLRRKPGDGAERAAPSGPPDRPGPAGEATPR